MGKENNVVCTYSVVLVSWVGNLPEPLVENIQITLLEADSELDLSVGRSVVTLHPVGRNRSTGVEDAARTSSQHWKR